MINEQVITDKEISDRAFNIKLEEIGWALFLIMVGGLWLLPDGRIPSHTWLIGAGVILLGINLVRYLSDIKMSGFTVFLGVVALVAGVAGIFSVELPVFPAVFIVLGVSLLLRAVFYKRT